MTTKVYNIKTGPDISPLALGNGQRMTLAVSVANGTNLLKVVPNQFSATNIGQWVGITTGSAFYGGKISAYNSGTTYVTIVDNANATYNYTGTTLVSSSQTVEWGTNDAPAFDSFNTVALAYQALHPNDTIELDIPAGIYEAGYPGSPTYPFSGIKTLNVVGTGSPQLSTCNGALSGVVFGGGGQRGGNSSTAKFATVSAASNTVTVIPCATLPSPGGNTVASALALFSVGQWVLLTGIDIQGPTGFPSNPGRFEYRQISAIDTTVISPTYGQITFSAPLTNAYKSTWPSYANPLTSGFDFGGPATIYKLEDGWDCTHVYDGLTLAYPDRYAALYGRDVTYQNGTWRAVPYDPRNGGLTPTVCGTCNLINVTAGANQMEVDKIVDILNITGCTFSDGLGNGVISFQSGSINHFNMDNTTTAVLEGTPANSLITNCTFFVHVALGPWSIGRCDSVVFSNCIIPNQLSGGGPALFGRGQFWYGTAGLNNVSGASMSAGLITIPTASLTAINYFGWINPGTWFTFADASSYTSTPTFYQVTDVTQDATNVYIQTTAPGGFPSWTYNPYLGIRVHSCPDLTVTNCAANTPTSVDDGSYAYGLSQAPAHTPFFSYVKFTLDHNTISQQPFTQLWGRIKTIKVTVNTAYTGSANPASMKPHPIHGYLDSSLGTVSYLPSIDMRKAGVRLLDASAGTYPVSWSSTAVGAADTLPSLTQALWWLEYIDKQATNVSDDPNVSVTLEITTNQGITSTAATSFPLLGGTLGLRLRA